MTKTWNSLTNTVDDALNLPKGRFAADFGFHVEQSVNLEDLLSVVSELKEKQINITTATQSGILVKAQEQGLLSDWAKLSTF